MGMGGWTEIQWEITMMGKRERGLFISHRCGHLCPAMRHLLQIRARFVGGGGSSCILPTDVGWPVSSELLAAVEEEAMVQG